MIISIVNEKGGVGKSTIAKYRQQLKIANSSERKKLYELS